MLTLLGQIAAAVAALGGLALIIFKTYWEPRAKARREAAKQGSQAADSLDASAVTAAFDKLRSSRK